MTKTITLSAEDAAFVAKALRYCGSGASLFCDNHTADRIAHQIENAEPNDDSP